MENLNLFELEILIRMRELFGNPVCDKIFAVITNLGSAVFLIALALFLTVPKKTRKAGVCSCLALLIGVIVVNLIVKNLVARIRPYDLVDYFKPLIDPPHGLSFPSGHANGTFEVAISLLFYRKKEGIAALCGAIVVCFTRLYLGVHYPSDVLFGILFGTASAVIAFFIVQKFYDRAEGFVLMKLGKNPPERYIEAEENEAEEEPENKPEEKPEREDPLGEDGFIR